MFESSDGRNNDSRVQQGELTRKAIQTGTQLIKNAIVEEGPYLGPIEYGIGVQEIVGAIASIDVGAATVVVAIEALTAVVTSLLTVNTAGFATLGTELGVVNSTLDTLRRNQEYNWPVRFDIGDRIWLQVDTSIPGVPRGRHLVERIANTSETVNPSMSVYLCFARGYNIRTVSGTTVWRNVLFYPADNMGNRIISNALPRAPFRCLMNHGANESYVTIERIYGT